MEFGSSLPCSEEPTSKNFSRGRYGSSVYFFNKEKKGYTPEKILEKQK
jgi:hypothetical protein